MQRSGSGKTSLLLEKYISALVMQNITKFKLDTQVQCAFYKTFKKKKGVLYHVFALASTNQGALCVHQAKLCGGRRDVLHVRRNKWKARSPFKLNIFNFHLVLISPKHEELVKHVLPCVHLH